MMRTIMEEGERFPMQEKAHRESGDVEKFFMHSEKQIILLGKSLRAIKNGKNEIRNISRDQK